MKLIGSTKSRINKDENGENVHDLQTTEVVLVYCNIVKNDYQQHSKLLYAFVPDKWFGQLLDISPKYFIYLRTYILFI